MNQEFTGVIEYLSLGINIFSDFRRHLFSSDARFAEVLVCRAEEYVNGLVVLLHVYDWPEEICGGFALVISGVQDYINRINERFNNFEQKGEECYQCPYEKRDETNKGAGRPRFLIPEEQLEGLRSGADPAKSLTSAFRRLPKMRSVWGHSLPKNFEIWSLGNGISCVLSESFLPLKDY